jgi:hypothetical protein
MVSQPPHAGDATQFVFAVGKHMVAHANEMRHTLVGTHGRTILPAMLAVPGDRCDANNTLHN